MCEQHCAELEQAATELKEALLSMVWQHCYRATIDGHAHLITGGLSANEDAFEALGWPDPRPCPEMECETDGCGNWQETHLRHPDGKHEFAPSIGGTYMKVCYACCRKGRTDAA